MSDTYIPGHTSYKRHELNVAASRYNISNDRVYRDVLTLPHDEKDIIIPANSIITSDLINNVSNKLVLSVHVHCIEELSKFMCVAKATLAVMAIGVTIGKKGSKKD